MSSMGTRFCAVLLALDVTLCVLACTQPRLDEGDILLITIDTLRADHLGSYGYPRNTSPHLDRWFAPGLIYERAYSTSSYTSASIASVLSGRLPQDHRVRLNDQLMLDDVVLVTDLLPPEY